MSGSSTVGTILSHDMDTLTSEVEITNRRITNAMKQAEEEKDTFVSFEVELRATSGALTRFLNKFLTKLYRANLIMEDITTLYQSIERISTGQMDPTLLHTKEVDYVLRKVSRLLKAKYSKLKLISMNPMYYYRQKDAKAIRINDTLLIIKNFQLTSLEQEFGIYQIKTFRIPAAANSTDATEIYNLPKYVITSANKNIIYKTETKPEVKDGMVSIYEKEISIEEEKTCISAVLKDNPKEMGTYCKAKFYPEGLKSGITRLNEDSVLLSNIKQYKIIESNGNRRNFTGCSMCIIKLPCGSAIKTEESLYLVARISSCENETTNQTIYSYNAHIVQEFYDTKTAMELFQLAKYVDREMDFKQVPKFTFNKKKEEDHAHIEKEAELELATLAKRIKEGKKLYKSKQEELDNMIQELGGDAKTYESWQDMSIIGTFAILIIIGITVAILWLKLRTLLITVMLLQQATLTKSEEVLQADKLERWLALAKNKEIQPREFNITSNQTQADTWKVLVEYVTQKPDVLKHYWYIIIVITLIGICKALRKLERKPNIRPTLIFNLSGNGEMVKLQGQTLSDFACNYVFEAYSPMKEIKIEGFWKKFLVITWDIRIFHIRATYPEKFNNKLRIP